MAWYLAPSLAVLRAEINTRWPNRDRTSDGSIGDAAHQASTSDHNPNSRGSVDAIDVDEDGVDFAAVFAVIKRHPSARYVIYERRLYHRLRGWQSEPYSGDNPHDKHFHLSIDQTRTAEQDTRPWGLLEDDMSEAEIIAALRKGVTSDPVIREALRQAPWEFLPADHGGKTSAHAIVLNGLPVLRAQLAALAGKDWVDEPAIIQGVLAALTPEKIAAAIPPTMAKQVADELSRRLAADPAS